MKEIGYKMVIYKIVNKINNKIYVGQTSRDIFKRLHDHSMSDMIIGRAIRKYGIQSFDVSVIDVAVDKQTLNEKEKYWIKKLNSLSPNGYNISVGGTGGNLGEIVNKKIGDTIRGRKHSEETLKKMRGKKRSRETREKMCHPHKKPKLGHMIGKTIRTEEYRKNIGLSSKGRKNPKLAEFNRSRTGQKQSVETQEKKRQSLRKFYENKIKDYKGDIR
jgi:group I intron endonuclease